jgi:hypothetical protein
MSAPYQGGPSAQSVVNEVNALRAEIAAQKEEFDSRLETSRNENNYLRTELQTLRSEVRRPEGSMDTSPEAGRATTTPTETVRQEQRPRARCPDVEPFDGEDLRNYRPFRINLYTKFLVDDQCFRSDEERILYAFSRLRAKASQRVLPWVIAKTNSQEPASLDEFYRTLDKAFSDPERQKRALVRVNTMKQGKRELKDFLTEFDAAMIDAGGLTWSEDQKKALLETAINSQILQGTIGVDQPDSYEDFCNQLYRIDHQQQRISRISRGGARPVAPSANLTARNDPDRMDWESTSAQIAALRGEVAALRSQDKGRARRATWVSDEEVQKRRSKGSCLRCGSQDHLVRQCPLQPARRPAQLAAVRATDDNQDEEDKDDDSGKE